MFGLGPMELLIIIVLALVVFGPSRLPKVGRMLGESVGNFNKFKSTASDMQNSVKKDLENIVLGPPENN
ncbi:MAG: Sec-independent protein translocase subunit TatA/TatB [Candidatus Geothermincolia bacterium]